jgi:hypothetical protein
MKTKFEKGDVVCYSGYRDFESPMEITYQNKKMVISKILERSVEELIPSGDRVYRFRVLVEDKKEFILLYNVKEDQWFIATQDLKSS